MDPASIDRGFKEVVGLAGHIDVLVNNGHEALGNDWTDVSAEQFSRHLANATGYFILARILREVPAARDQLPSKAFTSAGGGFIATDPRDAEGAREHGVWWR
jgi:gluconate 5-dehydrogenase